jgi:transposase
VIEGRSRDVLGDWLEARGDDWCARIRLATLDPAAGYRRAFEDRLPNVTLVVDHFHAIRLANRAIDDVRRRVQQHTLGHRGRKGDPLYRIRRILLTADEKLTEDRFAWMQAMLTEATRRGGGRRMDRQRAPPRRVSGGRRGPRPPAHDRLLHVVRRLRRPRTPPTRRHRQPLVRTDLRLPPHRRRLQRRVENIHMLAEKIRRIGHGFTNHDNYRRRLIGRLGIKWHTQPTARIRGRQPRFIA